MGSITYIHFSSRCFQNFFLIFCYYIIFFSVFSTLSYSFISLSLEIKSRPRNQLFVSVCCRSARCLFINFIFFYLFFFPKHKHKNPNPIKSRAIFLFGSLALEPKSFRSLCKSQICKIQISLQGPLFFSIWFLFADLDLFKALKVIFLFFSLFQIKKKKQFRRLLITITVFFNVFGLF